LIGGGSFGLPFEAYGYSLTATSLSGGGSLGTSSNLGSTTITAAYLNGAGTLGTSASITSSTTLAVASVLVASGVNGTASIMANATTSPANLVATGTLVPVAPSGSLVFNATTNSAAANLQPPVISASSLTIASTFPNMGMTVPPALNTDMRLQAAGLGVPGAMGNSYFAAGIMPGVSPLIGSGTLVGVKFHKGWIAKKYLPPRRFRAR